MYFSIWFFFLWMILFMFFFWMSFWLGTRLCIMLGDLQIRAFNIHRLCCWRLTMMIVSSHCTPSSYWQWVWCYVVFIIYPKRSSLMFANLLVAQTMQHTLCTSLEKSPQTRPIIGRIEHKAGHGGGMPTQKVVRTLILNILFSYYGYITPLTSNVFVL